MKAKGDTGESGVGGERETKHPDRRENWRYERGRETGEERKEMQKERDKVVK